MGAIIGGIATTFLYFFWDGFSGVTEVIAVGRLEYTLPKTHADYTLPKTIADYTLEMP